MQPPLIPPTLMPPPLRPPQAENLPPLTPALATGNEEDNCMSHIVFKKPVSNVTASKLVTLKKPLADAIISKMIIQGSRSISFDTNSNNDPLATLKSKEEIEQFCHEQKINANSPTFSIDYLLPTNKYKSIKNTTKNLRDVRKNVRTPTTYGMSANFPPNSTFVEGSREFQTWANTQNDPMSAKNEKLYEKSAESLPAISHESAEFSKNDSSHDQHRRKDRPTFYRESTLLNQIYPDSALPCLQEECEGKKISHTRIDESVDKEILCLSTKEKTNRVIDSTGQTEGGIGFLPIKHIQATTRGRHRMPQALPASQSQVRMHGTKKNSAEEHSHEYRHAGSSNDLPQRQSTAYKAQMTSRTPMQDIHEKQTRHEFRRPCSPSKPSQEHPTAQPAEKKVQPTPLIQNENTAIRARNLPDVQVLGAH